MLIDSHCHLDRLDLAPLGGSIGGALELAAAAGVTQVLSVATDLEGWPALARMTDPYTQVALSVGVHPSEEGGRPPTRAELVALGRAARVVAIGETGLDYHYGADSAARQQDWFRIHIAAARELGKPLIVHTRQARADTLRILAEEGAAEVGGVLHCFTEDWDMAQQALELNFYVSFSGIVTFKNPETGQLVQAQFTNSWMYDKQGLRLMMDGLGPGYAFELNSLKSPLEIFIGDQAAEAAADSELALEKSTASRGLLAVETNEADLYGYVDEIQDAVKCFTEGKDGFLNFEYGAKITMLCQAAYMAAEKGKTIDLTDPAVQEELKTYTSLIAQGRGGEVLF